MKKPRLPYSHSRKDAFGNLIKLLNKLKVTQRVHIATVSDAFYTFDYMKTVSNYIK